MQLMCVAFFLFATVDREALSTFSLNSNVSHVNITMHGKLYSLISDANTTDDLVLPSLQGSLSEIPPEQTANQFETSEASVQPSAVDCASTSQTNRGRQQQELKYLHISDLYKCVHKLEAAKRLSILVTGGQGFVGSHLVDRLLLDGHNVTVVDALWTGTPKNLKHWMLYDGYISIQADVTDTSWHDRLEKIDQIYHLASPASPKHYLADPVRTIQSIVLGTMNLLELARRHKARFVLASTSEVYGSPQVHPQSEDYWGNVNPIGPRSCYDESKRLAESMAVAYRDSKNVSIGIARIFNTYGPRMRVNDGRVISNFITQAMRNSSLTIYGSGHQTRSFQYVSDLVDGLKKLMSSDIMDPVNLGNPHETSILELAIKVNDLLSDSSSGQIINYELPVDDPPRRRPKIKLAQDRLSWTPKVSLSDGLQRTIEHFRHVMAVGGWTDDLTRDISYIYV